MVIICVWEGRGGGWFWDDSEDHGGFDRISPSGPFLTESEAMRSADEIFPGCIFEPGPPAHYADGDRPGVDYLPDGYRLTREMGRACDG